jgi:hypothetical protein
MRVLLVLVLVLTTLFSTAQRRKDMLGGAEDYRSLSNNGFQINIGPTYTLTKNTTLAVDDRTSYAIEPKGKIGFAVELGTANFSLKKPKFKFGKIIKYTDWGLGFNYYGGTESVYFLNQVDNSKTYVSDGNFNLGNISGRLTFHHLWHIKKTGVFLDNGVGINVDFRVVELSGYSKTVSEMASKGINQEFSGSLFGQIHYNFGIGFKLKRGSYLIPSIQVPFFGANKENIGTPKTNWFSSQYLPLIFRLKYIVLFEKRTKNGCENFGSEEDRKRNEEYLQNR